MYVLTIKILVHFKEKVCYEWFVAIELPVYLLAIYKFMKLNAADILKLCHKPR